MEWEAFLQVYQLGRPWDTFTSLEFEGILNENPNSDFLAGCWRMLRCPGFFS